MRKMIFVILFALGFVSQAIADGAPRTRIVVRPDCGELCRVYKQTRPHGLVPTDIDKVCIRIQQAQPGLVVIRFYNEAGIELDVGNKAHSNLKQSVDTFCVGRHYLVEAQNGHVEVCNNVKTKGLDSREIDILLRSGMPPTAAVQLFASR
jgi:hypothetical protein